MHDHECRNIARRDDDDDATTASLFLCLFRSLLRRDRRRVRFSLLAFFLLWVVSLLYILLRFRKDSIDNLDMADEVNPLSLSLSFTGHVGRRGERLRYRVVAAASAILAPLAKRGRDKNVRRTSAI